MGSSATEPRRWREDESSALALLIDVCPSSWTAREDGARALDQLVEHALVFLNSYLMLQACTNGCATEHATVLNHGVRVRARAS